MPDKPRPGQTWTDGEQTRKVLKVEARRLADLGLELMTEVHLNSDDEREVYWRRVADYAESKLPQPQQEHDPRNEPMSDLEASRFREAVMPFGKHEGTRVGDLPLSYLCNLLDPSPFMRDLRRYVKSASVQRELEREAERDDWRLDNHDL